MSACVLVCGCVLVLVWEWEWEWVWVWEWVWEWEWVMVMVMVIVIVIVIVIACISNLQFNGLTRGGGFVALGATPAHAKTNIIVAACGAGGAVKDR